MQRSCINYMTAYLVSVRSVVEIKFTGGRCAQSPKATHRVVINDIGV